MFYRERARPCVVCHTEGIYLTGLEQSLAPEKTQPVPTTTTWLTRENAVHRAPIALTAIEGPSTSFFWLGCREPREGSISEDQGLIIRNHGRERGPINHRKRTPVVFSGPGHHGPVETPGDDSDFGVHDASSGTGKEIQKKKTKNGVLCVDKGSNNVRVLKKCHHVTLLWRMATLPLLARGGQRNVLARGFVSREQPKCLYHAPLPVRKQAETRHCNQEMPRWPKTTRLATKRKSQNIALLATNKTAKHNSLHPSSSSQRQRAIS